MAARVGQPQGSVVRTKATAMPDCNAEMRHEADTERETGRQEYYAHNDVPHDEDVI